MAKLSRATIGNLIIALLAWIGASFGAQEGIERWLAHGTRTGFHAEPDSLAGVGRVLAMTASEAGTLHTALALFADSSYAHPRYAARLEQAGTILRVTQSLDRATGRARIDITGPATPFDSVSAPLFRWGAGDRLLLIPFNRAPVPSHLDAWVLTVDTKEGGDNSHVADMRGMLDAAFPIAWGAGAIAALVLAVGSAVKRAPAPAPMAPEAVVDALIQSITGEDEADSQRLQRVAHLIEAGQDHDAIVAQVPLDLKVVRERTAPYRASKKLQTVLETYIAYLSQVRDRIPTGLRP